MYIFSFSPLVFMVYRIIFNTSRYYWYCFGKYIQRKLQQLWTIWTIFFLSIMALLHMLVLVVYYAFLFFNGYLWWNNFGTSFTVYSRFIYNRFYCLELSIIYIFYSINSLIFLVNIARRIYMFRYCFCLYYSLFYVFIRERLIWSLLLVSS